MLNKTSKAFSIIELMITLVVLSLVLAAFTPVITKKLNPVLKGQSGGDKSEDDKRIEMLKAQYADMFMPAEASRGKTQTTADGGYFKCVNQYNSGSKNSGFFISCTVKIPSDHVSIVLVGAGGGGSSAANGLFEINRELNIVEGMKNGLVNFRGYTGIPGGNVYKIDNGPTEMEYLQECPEKTVEVTTISGSKFCVTKNNVRPSRYEDYHFNAVNPKTWLPENTSTEKEIKVELPEGTFLRDSGGDSEYTYILNNKSPVCWISYPENSYSKYGTVCNWWGAEKLCSNLDLGGNNCSDDGVNFNKPCKGRWRLMSYDETYPGLNKSASYGSDTHLYSIATHTLYQWHPNDVNIQKELSFPYGSNGSYCPGSSSGNACYGTKYALQSYNDTKAYYLYSNYSNGLNGNVGNTPKTDPQSVRCVLQRTKASPLYTAVYGGLGGSGAGVKNLKIPQDIVDKCISEYRDCKLVLESIYNKDEASASAGQQNALFGISAFGSAPDSRTGRDRAIYIKDYANNILWGYRVEGGKGGKGASFNAPGAKEDAIVGEGGKGGRLCWKYNVNTSSWGEPFDCVDETDGEGFSGDDAEKGEIVYQSKEKQVISGGVIPKYDTINYTAGDSFNSYIGMEYAAHTFDYIYRGGAGAGGGGGAFAHIIDIPIEPNKEYQVQIGLGGGFENYANMNGGDTRITLDDNTVITAQGGKQAGSPTGVKTGSVSSGSFYFVKYYHGKNAIKGLGGKFSATTDSDIIKAILADKTKTITADGADGTDGTDASDKNAAPSIGGSGGASGISVVTKVIKNSILCGGLFDDIVLGCSNGSNVNATTPDAILKLHAPVKHIFIDNNYGSYGAGGAGGGVSYAGDAPIAGKRGAGQDGYIYFYWKK